MYLKYCQYELTITCIYIIYIKLSYIKFFNITSWNSHESPNIPGTSLKQWLAHGTLLASKSFSLGLPGQLIFNTTEHPFQVAFPSIVKIASAITALFFSILCVIPCFFHLVLSTFVIRLICQGALFCVFYKLQYLPFFFFTASIN